MYKRYITTNHSLKELLNSKEIENYTEENDELAATKKCTDLEALFFKYLFFNENKPNKYIVKKFWFLLLTS